ncbi:hypothetical protein SASPL_142772 [Salvia splendens]|uniref:non-specific serine/threonine protein kinase n=1 Tax=Salvia splendens TaxID=180675 RepID=A0A8X8Z9S3_SALSN|nr:hypothetical protein SASPL_142772 [Salvia splendens]
MHTFVIHLNIYTLWFIFISRSSSAIDYRYEACGPRSCGNGPNISFPFYIKGLQKPYCGFPGFMLNCTSNGFPSLHISETKFIVKEIFYETRSLRVVDSAALNSDSNGCVPTIRNVSIPTAQFDYGENVTKLRFFSNCSDSMFEGGVGCDGGGRIVPMYEGDELVGDALGRCGRNTVAAVEGGGEVVEVLRRGFVMKWRASDCSECERSGGRCGFNETIYLFRCFCQNRPRYRSCRSYKERSRWLLPAAIFGGAVCLLVCMLIAFLIWQCKKRRSKSGPQTPNSDIEESRSFYLGAKIFSYRELMVATDSFSSSKEVGDGGYGTVYYGKLSDGREVAVKRLHEHNYRRMEQFMNEIKILTSLRHKNLVSLRSDEINLASMAVIQIERGAFVELVDEFLGFGSDGEIARMIMAVAELALRCLHVEKEMRPCMDEVLSVLNDICEGHYQFRDEILSSSLQFESE